MRWMVLFVICATWACTKKYGLQQVRVEDFQRFIQSTGYITDAEKYGWSIEQINVIDFLVKDSLTWNNPMGKGMPPLDHPVTQVSYNDAKAYAIWAGVTLPDYQQYWKVVESDQRPINVSSDHILPSDQTNMVGNTWEITIPDDLGRIRLAGGSYLCDENTCNGSSPDRVLHVDQITGNSHIGFAVVVER